MLLPTKGGTGLDEASGPACHPSFNLLREVDELKDPPNTKNVTHHARKSRLLLATGPTLNI